MMLRQRLDPARLGRLDRLLEGHVARGELAGAVALVASGDELHELAHGRLAFDGDAPAGADSLFRIASMTKPVAAAAALMLVEEARLRLDDPIERLLPEMADRRVLARPDGPLGDTVPARRSITLRDVLTFRLGIGVPIDGGDWPIQKAMAEARINAGALPAPLAPDEVARAYGALPLMHQPGEGWLYHNGYDLLGVLIARAAGMPLERFLQERIFGPLGMADTGFTVSEAARHRLATPYKADADGTLRPFPTGQQAALASGGTGLISTARDYLAFGQMMLAMGRHPGGRLLSRATVEAMVTDQIPAAVKDASPFFPTFWDDRGWGMGVAVYTRRTGPAASPGRFGWDGGLGTSWYADPAHDLTAVLMIQRAFDPLVIGLHADFWTLVYQAIDD